MTSAGRMSRRRFMVAAAGGAGAVLAAPPMLRAQTTYAMKIGTPTLNDAQHEWMRRFAKLIEDSSDGQIKPQLYPASQLGTAPRMIEGTQLGSIQAVVIPPEFLSGVDRRYAMLSAPGIFKDFAHVRRGLADPSVYDTYMKIGEDRGLHGIGLFGNAEITINCRTKLKSPEDVKGKKIRVLASEMQTRQIEMLGGTAVPMPLGEVLPAVQQGTIDGVLGAAGVLTAFHFYDASPFILDTRHAAVTVISLVSKSWFASLPPELQKAVDEAGKKASNDIYDWAVDFNEKQRGVWTSNGGTIVDMSDEQRAMLLAKMRPIGEEVASNSAGEKEVYDLLLKAAKETA